MARHFVLQLLAWALFCPSAISQTASGDESNTEHKRLIEQKIRLVESLVKAPANQGDGETPPLLAVWKTFLDRIRIAMAANQFDVAATEVDEALRKAIKASQRPAGKADPQATETQEAGFATLTGQIATFRTALEELAKQGSTDARAAVARIGELQADAARAAEAGRWPDANRRLSDAYRLAIESISRLRAGQTVTLSLNFETPRVEYDYETRRFDSTSLMVNMMIDDGRAAGERRKLVDGFNREGGRLRLEAGGQAQSGDYKAAIATMENAVGQLNRALQVMGVPAF